MKHYHTVIYYCSWSTQAGHCVHTYVRFHLAVVLVLTTMYSSACTMLEDRHPKAARITVRAARNSHLQTSAMAGAQGCCRTSWKGLCPSTGSCAKEPCHTPKPQPASIGCADTATPAIRMQGAARGGTPKPKPRLKGLWFLTILAVSSPPRSWWRLLPRPSQQRSTQHRLFAISCTSYI